MKKRLLAFIFLLAFVNLFGQMPTMSKPSKTNYSNNTILTADDMVFNQEKKVFKKVPLDKNSIIIYDYDGSLKSFNLKTETINWTVKATKPYTEMCGNKLTIQDGIVYVPFITGEIFALNNQTGEAIWKARLGLIEDEIVLKNQTPSINDGKLYITAKGRNSNIYALDIKDGGLIWNYKLAYPYNHLPVLYFNNKVFTQSAPYFYSFEANTGKALYQRGFEKAMYGKPVTDGENVFIANDSDLLFALSPEKLDILWQFQLEKGQHDIKERIFCKSSKIYFAGRSSKTSSVYALDSKTGNQLWKTDFKENNVEYITEQNNTLWGYSENGLLFQLDLQNGKILFENKVSSKPISNIEFLNDNSLFYYCEAGLIQFDVLSKKENLVYIRSSINDDARDAFIKLLK